MAKVPTICVTLTPQLKAWIIDQKSKHPFVSVSKLVEQGCLGKLGASVAPGTNPEKGTPGYKFDPLLGIKL